MVASFEANSGHESPVTEDTTFSIARLTRPASQWDTARNRRIKKKPLRSHSPSNHAGVQTKKSNDSSPGAPSGPIITRTVAWKFEGSSGWTDSRSSPRGDPMCRILGFISGSYRPLPCCTAPYMETSALSVANSRSMHSLTLLFANSEATRIAFLIALVFDDP